MQAVEIVAGSYAVLQYKGPCADMKATYEWFYGDWLVKSGYELADASVFEEFLNSPQGTAPNDLLTDIYLLLA